MPLGRVTIRQTNALIIAAKEEGESRTAEGRRKLVQARELRKQEHLQLRQRLIPWPKATEPSLVSAGGLSH